MKKSNKFVCDFLSSPVMHKQSLAGVVVCFFWLLHRNRHDVCMFKGLRNRLWHVHFLCSATFWIFCSSLYPNDYSILSSVLSKAIKYYEGLSWTYPDFIEQMFVLPVCVWKILSLYSILIKQRAALISCACLSNEASQNRRHWSTVNPFELQLTRLQISSYYFTLTVYSAFIVGLKSYWPLPFEKRAFFPWCLPFGDAC